MKAEPRDSPESAREEQMEPSTNTGDSRQKDIIPDGGKRETGRLQGNGVFNRAYSNLSDHSVFEQDEEHDRFHDNKRAVPGSRPPSALDNVSESNTEVIMRPKHPKRQRIVSAVVTPSQNYLPPRKTHSTSDLQKLGVQRKALKSKNENMVLQLVLPNQNSNHENNNNYLTTRSIDEILGNGHLKERSTSRPLSINSQTQDFYVSPAGGSYLNRAYSAGDLSQYGRPGESPGGYSTPSASDDKPTPPEEKKRAFTELLTNVLSVFYALLNVTLGLAVYISDLIDSTHQVSEVFSLILVVIAFIYILYLTIDISLYQRKKAQYEKLLDRNTAEQIEMKETPEGHYHFSITLPDAVTLKQTLPHHYCFKTDRHSTNFFLKIGAAAFCFGHLIHSGLLLGYQIVFLTSDDEAFYECASFVVLVLDFIYPIYSFLLLFFIFKFSNVIINRHAVLARFGVMHCLSSSICFWLWTIFREILEALALYESDYENGNATESYNSQPHALPLSSLNEKGAQILKEYLAASPRRFTVMCQHDVETMRSIYRDFSPYLYPFSVEFSILVVGILFLVWQNIAMCKVEDDVDDEEASTKLCKTPSGNKDNIESNVAVHADCHVSNKGIFMGFIILVLTVVSTILFFIAVYTDGGRRGELGVMINIVTSLFILACMTFACVWGYHQIIKLDLNAAHHNLLDDVLLFICIPAYFLNGIFSIIPAIIHANVIGSINICLEVFQVLFQTCFILDGLRRSSNCKDLRKKKPGREMVTFLVICNVALWIMQTFEVKNHGIQDHRYDFYGRELWTILGHMCLPLMMFYRFHAAVCFGDVWKYAYERSGH